MEQNKVKIKRGTVEINFFRTDLVDVVEASDGIVFQLKNMMITCQDNVLPNTTKRQIKVSVDTFSTGNLLIDLDNHRRPVSIDNTKSV